MVKTSRILNLLIGFSLAFIMATPKVWAQNSSWVRVNQFHWYNSKYTFLDQETGLLVVEISNNVRGGRFEYHVRAIDCDDWVSFPLTGNHKDQNYTFNTYWRTNPSVQKIVPNSFVDTAAKKLCPDRYKLPQSNIPE